MNRYLIFLFSILPLLSLKAQTSPEFELINSDGDVFKIYEDYLDQDKVVFIEFMFISCPFCTQYLPHMKDLYESYDSGNGDVEFFKITIMGGDTNSKMADYKTQNEIDFQLVGSDGGALDIFTEYSNGSYGDFFSTPTFAILDTEGEVTLMRPPGNAATWNPVLKDSIDAAIANISTPPPPPPPAPTYSIGGSILSANGQIWEAVPNSPNIVIALTGDTSLLTTNNPFVFEGIKEGMNVEVSAMVSQDNPVEGLTTFDLVLISQYILSIGDFNLVQQIAADVNCSGTITTFDIISIRQLILYLSENLPCQSYISVPESFLNDPNSILSKSIPDKIILNNIDTDHINQNFNLIKKGNINQ